MIARITYSAIIAAKVYIDIFAFSICAFEAMRCRRLAWQ